MKRGIQKMEEKETRFDRSTERSECLIAEYKKPVSYTHLHFRSKTAMSFKSSVSLHVRVIA